MLPPPHLDNILCAHRARSRTKAVPGSLYGPRQIMSSREIPASKMIASGGAAHSESRTDFNFPCKYAAGAAAVAVALVAAITAWKVLRVDKYAVRGISVVMFALFAS